jgi:hypothetical protein
MSRKYAKMPAKRRKVTFGDDTVSPFLHSRHIGYSFN